MTNEFDEDLDALLGEEQIDASHYLAPKSAAVSKPYPKFEDIAPPPYRPDLGKSKPALANASTPSAGAPPQALTSSNPAIQPNPPSNARLIPPPRPARANTVPNASAKEPNGDGLAASNVDQAPNHRAIGTTPQNGNQSAMGGSGGGGGGSANGKGPNKDSDNPGLPEAPTDKIMSPAERAKFVAEEAQRKELEKVQKARKEQQEAAKRSESQLYMLRRQFEDAQIKEKRVEDYKRRRVHQAALAKECARRMTYPPATHESRMPAPEDPLIAKELAHLTFKDGWRSVFAAFHVEKQEEGIKSALADEEFCGFFATFGSKSVDARFVREYLMMVLEGAPAGPSVRRIIPSPPEQHDPDSAQRVPYYALGRCLKAVPTIFTSLLSHQMDILSDTRRGELNENDWYRLLNTAKGHVSSLLALSLGTLFEKYPHIMSPDSRIVQDPSVETRLFVRECLQQALVGLFERGLGLFYYQVCAKDDKAVILLADRWRGQSLLQVAILLGIGPRSPAALRLEREPALEAAIVDPLRTALELVCSPSLRLSLFVEASRALGSMGLSGDEFLPLLTAGLLVAVASSSRHIKLASIILMMDDFGLPEDFRLGESGFVCSSVRTALEVLLDESRTQQQRPATKLIAPAKKASNEEERAPESDIAKANDASTDVPQAFQDSADEQSDATATTRGAVEEVLHVISSRNEQNDGDIDVDAVRELVSKFLADEAAASSDASVMTQPPLSSPAKDDNLERSQDVTDVGQQSVADVVDLRKAEDVNLQARQTRGEEKLLAKDDGDNKEHVPASNSSVDSVAALLSAVPPVPTDVSVELPSPASHPVDLPSSDNADLIEKRFFDPSSMDLLYPAGETGEFGDDSIEKRFFDPKESAIDQVNAPASESGGHEIEKRFFDPSGIGKDLFNAPTSESKGHEIEKRFFDPSGIGKDLFNAPTSESKGHEIEKRFFDPSGIGKDLFNAPASETEKPNEEVIEKRFFDPSAISLLNAPVESSKSLAALFNHEEDALTSPESRSPADPTASSAQSPSVEEHALDLPAGEGANAQALGLLALAHHQALNSVSEGTPTKGGEGTTGVKRTQADLTEGEGSISDLMSPKLSWINEEETKQDPSSGDINPSRDMDEVD